jgi:5-methylcytosine-specific restriction endonuclease McrA
MFYESAEYKRLQNEGEAAKQGRVLCGYVPRDERARLAAARAAVQIPEDGAKRMRKRFIRSLLKDFNRIASKAFPEVVSALRKESAAHSRKKYQQDAAQERLRTATYKATHRDQMVEHEQTRQARIDATCDGSATKESIRESKAAASRCAYCDCPFEDARKQTDHMVALCHGAEHSLRNIVIVCRPCNARKASLTYEQWIERVEPEHRVRVQCLWIARHPPADRAIPLFAAYAGLAHLPGGAVRCCAAVSARRAPRWRVHQPANPAPRGATQAAGAPTGQHPVEIAGPVRRLSAAGGLVAHSL